MQPSLKYIVFTIMLLLVSCNEKSKVNFGDQRFTLIPNQLEIESTTIVSWPVGPLRRQRVSKGYTFKIKFPELDREDLEKLTKEHNIDSWLVKVRKRSYNSNFVLGYLYIPIVVPGTQAKSKYRRHQMKTGTFSVFYSAASVSSRLARLSCPAFDHNRSIEEIEIKPTDTEEKTLFSGVMEEKTILAKVDQYSYSGNSFNSGNEMIGEYTVEVAFYNHKSKVKKSNFLKLAQKVVVSKEGATEIKGCAGYKIPPFRKEIDKEKLFRWKK